MIRMKASNGQTSSVFRRLRLSKKKKEEKKSPAFAACVLSGIEEAMQLKQSR